jgi:hypothetical protein
MSSADRFAGRLGPRELRDGVHGRLLADAEALEVLVAAEEAGVVVVEAQPLGARRRDEVEVAGAAEGVQHSLVSVPGDTQVVSSDDEVCVVAAAMHVGRDPAWRIASGFFGEEIVGVQLVFYGIEGDYIAGILLE